MMSADHSQEQGHQSWAGHNGWSPTSPKGALRDPLPSFHHLSLGSPSDPHAPNNRSHLLEHPKETDQHTNQCYYEHPKVSHHCQEHLETPTHLQTSTDHSYDNPQAPNQSYYEHPKASYNSQENIQVPSQSYKHQQTPTNYHEGYHKHLKEQNQSFGHAKETKQSCEQLQTPINYHRGYNERLQPPNHSQEHPQTPNQSYDNLQAPNQSYENLQTPNQTSFAPIDGAQRHYIHANNATQNFSGVIPDSQIDPVLPNPSQVRNIPPSSLPLTNQGQQHLHPHHQVPFHSPYSPYQAAPSYVHHSSQNGPQSPHQQHIPISSRSLGQCASQREIVKPCVGFTPQISPSSPVQTLQNWTAQTQSGGTISQFVPTAQAASQENTHSPQSPSSESRYGLDPDLLPSAVKVAAEDRLEWEGKVFVSEPFSCLPPLPTTSCIVEDRGNASPAAIRSLCYSVPREGQMSALSRLPLGALLTPLAGLNDGQTPLALCTEAECVPGCASCGASMCQSMDWQDCGQTFHCPFCGKLNEVSWQNYQPTRGPVGVRVDQDKRPELSLGSYEILNTHKGEAAALILAVDVSASALRGGHLEFVTQQILCLFSAMERADGELRVGLITYDSRVHLYDLSPALSRPHMMVVTETETDLQLPVRDGLLVALKDCRESLESVLQLIPQFTVSDCDNTSSGIPIELPIRAGLTVLQALGCPGRMLIFHTAPLIESRNTHTSSGLFGSNTPKSIFQPSDPAVSLAKECVSHGCGVHLFVLSQQAVGGAWPGHIPFLTGGALYNYSHLQGELDREHFTSDLNRVTETHTGYKAELRIYVSKDMRVSGCYGLFLPGLSPALVTMSTLHSQTTLAVELAHSRALDEAKGAAIQTVLSYSTQSGERRTRVHTLTVKVSRQLQDVFRHCQAQTLLAFYCKKIYCAVLERPLQELREELQTEITEALASYRKHGCSAAVSGGQLVLPQFLRSLPVYMNSLRKSEVLLPGLRTSVHQRLLLRCHVLSMDTRSTVTHFYPTLLPLPLSGDSCDPVNTLESLRCRCASLDQGRVYLLHAPLTLLLWVGAKVPECTLVCLFNTSCFSLLQSGETKLPLLDNSLSVSVRSLIDKLDSEALCARKLCVVKQGDTCEEALQRHLVEDKSPNGGASYADFLYHLHVNSVRMLQ